MAYQNIPILELIEISNADPVESNAFIYFKGLKQDTKNKAATPHEYFFETGNHWAFEPATMARKSSSL